MAYEHIKEAMDRAGKTQAELAEILKRSPGVITNLFQGVRKLTIEDSAKIAKWLGKSINFVMFGEDDTALVPVVGKIGAGAKIFYVDDTPDDIGGDMVPLPQGVKNGAVALRIEGDSMLPLEAGWLVYYSDHSTDIDRECLNQLCVVRLTSGETYLKKLIRGSEKSRYHLFSYNAPVIENAEVEWCAKVRSITPK